MEGSKEIFLDDKDEKNGSQGERGERVVGFTYKNLVHHNEGKNLHDLASVKNLKIIEKLKEFEYGSNSGGGSGVVVEYDGWEAAPGSTGWDKSGNAIDFELGKPVRVRREIYKYITGDHDGYPSDTRNLSEDWEKLQKLGLV